MSTNFFIDALLSSHHESKTRATLLLNSFFHDQTFHSGKTKHRSPFIPSHHSRSLQIVSIARAPVILTKMIARHWTRAPQPLVASGRLSPTNNYLNSSPNFNRRSISPSWNARRSLRRSISRRFKWRSGGRIVAPNGNASKRRNCGNSQRTAKRTIKFCVQYQYMWKNISERDAFFDVFVEKWRIWTEI